ncbi:MAG: hypothetical protein MUC55_10235 [Burkholderiales bacterium]|jgi:hypothetical protein|nr:hypothetical protein [Burkholderiales bacterium]
MHDPSATRARLVALFLLGAVLFGYPALAVFNVPGSVLGVPVLYAYLFAAWAALVALVAVVARRD